MAADLLREKGWEIDLKVGRTHNELISELAVARSGVIGLSASSDRTVDALARLDVALRISQPRAFILVSGGAALSDTDKVRLMDVDAVVTSVEQAHDVMLAHCQDEFDVRPGVDQR